MSATLELLRAAQKGDRDACEQAVIENNGLIWSVVRRYYGRGVEPDDLYQLGCLGFLKAVQGFDFDYGTCFSTYAVPKIAGEIRRFLRDDGTLKVGRSIREKAQTLYSIRERLRHELGREPFLSELSEAAGMTPEEILARALDGMEFDVLDTGEPVYRCTCSRRRVERALLSMGEKALRELPDEQGETEVTCRFCDKVYCFTEEELEQLLRDSRQS